ncbi:MAG: preprotein translocase subunit SecG [Pseudomonadota bacterium]
MQNVILVIHLILAICLIAAVLLQRSEGGALGIGGGGGGSIGTRSQTTPAAKITWGLATAFLTTSILLAILAGGDPGGRSVLDEVQGAPEDGIILPDLPAPASEGIVPPAAEEGGGAGGFALPDANGGESAPVAPPSAD